MEQFETSTGTARPRATISWDGGAAEADSSPTATPSGFKDLPVSATLECSDVDASQQPDTASTPTDLAIGIKDSAFHALNFDTSSGWDPAQSFDLGFAATTSHLEVCTPPAPAAAFSVSSSLGASSPTKHSSLRSTRGKRLRSSEGIFPMESDANTALASEESEDEGRPLVSKDEVIRYMNETALEHFLLEHDLKAEQYFEGVSFSIGEGGREFLRAALLHYSDGRTLQGASVTQLLKHAHSLYALPAYGLMKAYGFRLDGRPAQCPELHCGGLWPLVQRIRAERLARTLTGLHLAFSNFKAAQSRRRRHCATTTMHAIRDADGRILSIIYDPSKTLPIGLLGRGKLKLLITERMDEDPAKATELLIEHGLHGVRLREATVAELLAVAWVLGLWRSVEEIVQAKEEHKRSLSARNPAAENRKVRRKKRCEMVQHSADREKATDDHSTALEGVSAGESSSDPCFFSAATQPVTAFEPLAGSTWKPLAPLDAANPPTDAAYAGVQDDSRGTAIGQNQITQQQSTLQAPTETSVRASSTETCPAGDPCGHIERIGQLVSTANPTAPNAKSVAVEVIKELLALVKKGLLPDPPAEVLAQLQSAAVRLGVDETPINAPQAR